MTSFMTICPNCQYQFLLPDHEYVECPRCHAVGKKEKMPLTVPGIKFTATASVN